MSIWAKVTVSRSQGVSPFVATSLESRCIYHPGSLNAVLPAGQVRRQTQHNISIFSQQTNGSTEENKTDLSLLESRLIIKQAGSFFSHLNWHTLHILKQSQLYWVALVFCEFKYKQTNKNLTKNPSSLTLMHIPIAIKDSVERTAQGAS